MNKFLVALAIAVSSLGIVSISDAQSAGPRNQDPTKQGARQSARKAQQDILAKLNLTADQKAKLKTHREKMQEKMNALRAEIGKDKAAAKKGAALEKVQALRKEQMDGIKKILTADQLKKFEDLTKEARKNRTAKKGGTARRNG